MIKRILVFVSIFTVMVMRVETVSAAPSAGGAVIELETAHGGASGAVFIFKVSGEFSKAELKGSAQVSDGSEFTIYCDQLDAETVRCLTSSKVWGDVTVTFGGVSFTTRIGLFEPAKYCYGVWDWDYETESVWVQIGTYCQSQPASYGDVIYNFYNPEWDDYYDYEFLPNSPSCPFYQPGDAFYYPDCPL